jgi:glycogen operon protein
VRQPDFLHGAIRPSDGKPDVEWRAFDGAALDWVNPDLASLCLHLRGNAESVTGRRLTEEVLLAFNRTDTDQRLVLPDSETRVWSREIDTSIAQQTSVPVTTRDILVPQHSISAFVLSEGATP